MSLDDKILETMRNMSRTELRAALEFHMHHIRLLHQEVDRRIGELTKVEGGSDGTGL